MGAPLLLTFPLSDEPYRTIARFFLSSGARRISPQDSETRLFLGDIPLVAATDTERPELLPADRFLFLASDGSFLARGDTPQQAEVRAAVGRFALFVHFFALMLRKRRAEKMTGFESRTVRALLAATPPFSPLPRLMGGLNDIGRVRNAIVEAGKALVEAGLVDSIFGNISCRIGESLLISRTGAALDRLGTGVASCPLAAGDGTPFGASVEYPSHRRIVLETPSRCVLHAHPRWSVVLSLVETGPTLLGLPVVEGTPGEGLAAVLPPAIARNGAAVVRGHGLFAAGRHDFNEPFAVIHRIEREAFAACRAAFS